MSYSEAKVLISKGEPVSELNRMENLLQTVTAGYGNAVRSTAQYAIEIDSLDAQLFRQHIEALEEQVGTAAATEHWEALQVSFRNELRAYRDKATEQLERMRADIKAAADAMLIFAESVASNGLDHQEQLQEELGQLKSAIEDENLSQVRAVIGSAVSTITASVAKMQSSHKLVIAQLRDEMRLLHKQIDTERRTLYTDRTTGLWNRQKLDSQITDRLENDQAFCMLLVRLRNLKQLETGYSRAVVEGAIKALLQRFTAMIGEQTLLGRWNDENFAAILDIEQAEAIAISREATAKLSGTYSVLGNGAWQNVPLEAVAAVIDHPAHGDGASFHQDLLKMSAALSNA
ncbi:MAG TPA: diguanylate cyclase [Bryobacteraceae bacterium]|jgi:GGDEF domain-containing protein|nr:diguanylate cyclase [Bryobacteraceae bacterium]